MRGSIGAQGHQQARERSNHASRELPHTGQAQAQRIGFFLVLGMCSPSTNAANALNRLLPPHTPSQHTVHLHLPAPPFCNSPLTLTQVHIQLVALRVALHSHHAPRQRLIRPAVVRVGQEQRRAGLAGLARGPCRAEAASGQGVG